MTKYLYTICFILIHFTFCNSAVAEWFTPEENQQIKSLTESALEKIRKYEPFFTPVETCVNPQTGLGQLYSLQTGIQLAIKNINGSSHIKSSDFLQKSDSLFIGVPPSDSLIISGKWEYNGTIVILLNGLLKFKKAQATIFGNIIILGNGRLEIDSSYMYFPQEYFYQRIIMAIQNSTVKISNSVLDNSGLSHNFMAAQNARVEMYNVTNKGFTTSGYYDNSSLNLDGTNEAGEFVLVEKTKVSIKNARTVLLWHQLPDGSKLNITFPDGNLVNSYRFDTLQQGIKGFGYKVKVDTCTDVMWALMPSNGSDATISDSKLRAIGLWFEDTLKAELNGLVNNSVYQDFLLNLPDRKLHFKNTDVMTWSIYPMGTSDINLTGCIIGELGGMGRSKTQAVKYLCDGSGGYIWAGDTSFVVSGFSSATTSVRSQNSGILIFGYSALTLGAASATGNSIMMCVQSSMPEDPFPYDGSCVWMANINGPGIGRANSKVAITGSVWIDKTPTSYLMDFKSYSLYYRKTDETDWNPLALNITKEKRNDTLALWDTKGIEPYNYTIRLVLISSTNDSVDAVKNINITPNILDVPGIVESPKIILFPNPVRDKCIVVLKEIPIEPAVVEIYDVFGEKVKQVIFEQKNEFINLDLSELEPGVYFCSLIQSTLKSLIKFELSK